MFAFIKHFIKENNDQRVTLDFPHLADCTEPRNQLAEPMLAKCNQCYFNKTVSRFLSTTKQFTTSQYYMRITPQT